MWGLVAVAVGCAVGYFGYLEYSSRVAEEMRDDIMPDSPDEADEFRDIDGDGNWDERTIEIEDSDPDGSHNESDPSSAEPDEKESLARDDESKINNQIDDASDQNAKNLYEEEDDDDSV